MAKYIGHNAVPAKGGASGVWGLDAASRARKLDQWPIIYEPTSARYWRWLITRSANPSINYMILSEIELRSIFGGADITTGKTATASSQYSEDYGASKTIDNDFDNTELSVHDASPPWWLKIDLGESLPVAEYMLYMTTRNTNFKSDYAPLDWQFQYSTDDVNWTTKHTVTNANWSGNSLTYSGF
jgi:hypothetical protein